MAFQSRNVRIAAPYWALAILSVVTVVTAACEFASPGQPSGTAAGAAPSRWGTSPVFTPAHNSASDAVRAFFGVRPDARQPFDFSHQIHLSKGVLCTDCHTGVEKGPVAGIPSINTCMICHSQIATDRPLIKTLTEMQEKGRELDWQRVYGWLPQAHVRFDHAPHIRAKVDCSSCHGNLAEQTVAQRAVNMNMSFCVNCHKSKQASNDCLTCHY